MPEITIAIIEDNLHDADNLADMLALHFSELKVIAIINNYKEAVEKLPILNPDLLFLDINLPGNYTGFDILKACQPKVFNIIFTTAYDRYAIEAIRASALDYLLKPFDLSALSDALKRVLTKIDAGKNDTVAGDLGVIKNRVIRNTGKIMVHSAGNVMFIAPDDIIRIEASGAYSVFFLGNGSKITASHSLQFYEDELDNNYFFRTHRSFIININKVKSLKRNNNGGMLTLYDNVEVNITKEKLDQFLRLFSEEN